MGQFGKVLLAIDNAHTAPQRAMNCGPGLGLTMISLMSILLICLAFVRH